MFEQVLVGVDGRESGRDAIALASSLVGPSAHCVVATTEPGAASGRAASFRLEAADRDGKAPLPGEPRRTRIPAEPITNGDGPPGRALHELARSERADLVVVGPGLRRHLSRLLLGSGALPDADRSPCAVAVAPARYRVHSAGWRTIGVADDGSALSEHALAVACELAGAHQASVRALSMLGPENISSPELTPAEGSPLAARNEQRRRARLAALPGVEGDVVRGWTVDLLLALSAEVDLLVAGTRPQGPISRRLLGITAQRLAAATRSPLLVLPPGFSPALAAPDAGSGDSRPLATPTC